MIRKAVLFLFVFFLAILMIACQDERLQQPLFQYSMNNPADSGSRYPNIYVDNTGKMYLSWLVPIEEDIATVQYSTYKNERWTLPKTVHIDTDFFVNWADFPSVVGYEGTEVAAHWLRKVEGGPYAYDVQISFFDEDRNRWGEAIKPHLDMTATEHGFVSLEPIDSDKVLAVWLDGRETAGRADDEYSDTSKSMTLRSAEISRSGEITNSQIIDGTVCDCCQTDLAKTDDGFVVVYRGRTAEEIRDIKIAHYNTDSGTWSEPVTVHDDGWQIMACPVNGPRVVANGNQVAVVWYTGEGDNPRVSVATSADGGQTFGDPVEMPESESRVLGRADLVIGDDGSVYVSWMQEFEGSGYIMMAEVGPDGTVSDEQTVGITDASRTSGFPRIALVDDSLVFAWTQTDPIVRLRTAKVDLEP
ncbi:exo-alpha-sialidase [Rhodohalobacter sp. 614A]|uniref:exo-alpha-sialidase n=1 Tax=Rhodohalobacter sp. 614A TaxID=2908649 RepID=UPI001F38FE14|nr:exo-alpha-sialidase [Rhodohalobacter sp. 614A]